MTLDPRPGCGSGPLLVPLSTGGGRAVAARAGRVVSQHGGGTRGDQAKTSPEMTKPRWETCSHLGFYVEMTGFEPATP